MEIFKTLFCITFAGVVLLVVARHITADYFKRKNNALKDLVRG